MNLYLKMKKVAKKKSKKKSVRVGKYVFPTQALAEKFIDKQRQHMDNILIFRSLFVNSISWPIFNEIEENQDLYKNKDDF